MNTQSSTPQNFQTRLRNRLKLILLTITVLLGLMLACGVTLRLSVGLTSDPPVAPSAPAELSENSKTHPRTDRQKEHERIREKALRDDRWLLQQRQDRLWREQNRDQPPRFAAYEKWLAEVTEIEQLVAEAEQVQSGLSPEESLRGPLAEGTLLWHRKQRLLQLREDPPQP